MVDVRGGVPRRLPLILILLGTLTACGGGGGAGGGAGDSATTAVPEPVALTEGSNAPPAQPADAVGARRLLAQASFGATPEALERVVTLGYEGWVSEQLQAPAQAYTHLATAEASARARGQDRALSADVVNTWWTHALTAPGQLKQRVAYALSQIFVVSTEGGGLDGQGRMVASYLDMLTAKGTGRYRDLLEAVALHPAMGLYLSHARNRKHDPITGRTPDENFARELMQLFSIGLHELNVDGTPKLRNGQLVETYGPDDVKGMAMVFTGWSAARPPGNRAPWWACFWLNDTCRSDVQEVLPMEPYAEEHATGEKRFLGVVVPAQSTPNPRASLKVALDRLASHPNTAPFMGRQLIQHLVTSNPSPAYVRRITEVWLRTDGHLGQVVRAILLDPEARQPQAQGVDMRRHGLLREPVLRLAQLLRAMPHRSARYQQGGSTPFYRAINTSDTSTALGQTPLAAPSVFNFYRPAYRPAQSDLAAQQLVSPQMQLVNENSVLGYAKFMARILERGWGEVPSGGQAADIQLDLSALIALDRGTSREGAQAMLQAVCMRLLGADLPEPIMTDAVTAIADLPRGSASALQRRAATAVLLVVVSPPYLVQQ
jgi:uncharacterized protein (DUF1800 family)